MLDEGRWNRLCTDVHEPPLVKLVILRFKLAAIELQEDVLGPWDEKPDDGSTLFAHCFECPFRGDTLQDDCLAADDEAPEPVHLRTRVVKRGNEDKNVSLSLPVMGVFSNTGTCHIFMGQEYGFGLTRCTGSKVETACIVEG